MGAGILWFSLASALLPSVAITPWTAAAGLTLPAVLAARFLVGFGEGELLALDVGPGSCCRFFQVAGRRCQCALPSAPANTVPMLYCSPNATAAGVALPAMNNLIARNIDPSKKATALGAVFTGFHTGGWPDGCAGGWVRAASSLLLPSTAGMPFNVLVLF